MDILRFPGFLSLGKRLVVGRSIFFVKDAATSLFNSRNRSLLLSISSSGRSEGERREQPSRRSSDSGKKAAKNNVNKSKKPNSSNQEEIIALFRRIQSSIGKERSTKSSKKEDSNSSKYAAVPADSFLRVLGESSKEAKGGKMLRNSRRKSGEEQSTRNGSRQEEFKLSRPPSKFVKKSPIPFPSAQRVKVLEMSDEEAEPGNGIEELKLAITEEMKLAQLKEIAKSRGIKGYSKLKKKELQQLLTS